MRNNAIVFLEGLIDSLSADIEGLDFQLEMNRKDDPKVASLFEGLQQKYLEARETALHASNLLRN